MQWIPLVSTFVIAFVIYSLILKLSAILLRFRIEWTHTFAFAALMGVCSLAANVGSAVTGYQGIFTVLAFVAIISLGAWYFRTRGVRANDQQIGWKGGATLAAVTIVVAIAIGISMILLVHLLRSTA